MGRGSVARSATAIFRMKVLRRDTMPRCAFRWFSVAAGLLLLGIPLSGRTWTETEMTSPQGASDPRHVRLGIVSDWTHHHVLYPDSKDDSAMARIRRDPRWVQSWYLRHPEAWRPI